MEKVKNFLFKNTSTKQTVVKNTFWLFFGEIIGRLFKLGIIVFATRALGAEGWGVFSYALAFVSLAYIFADIGINTFVTRELSKDDPDKYKYLSAALVFKLILLLVSLLASVLIIPYFGSISLQLPLVIAIALLNFSDSLREFFLSVNRAFQKMEREASIKIIMSVAITLLGTLLILHNPTPLSLAIAYAAGSIIATVATIFWLPKDFKNIEWKFPFSYMKTIFDFAWPFIALTVFSTALVTIDSIMLGQMKSATEVGLYSAAQRIIQFLAIIPIYIGISLFPLLSKREGNDLASSEIFEKTMVIVLAIAFPLAIGGFLLSHQIVTLLFGASFILAAPVLAILMIVIIADFSYIILNNIIYVKNIQRKFILASFVGLVINILLNIYLIPHYGAIGAAIATALAQALIMIMNWVKLKKFFAFSVVPKLGIIIVSSIVMGGVIFVCNLLGVYFFLAIIIAAISYVLLLFILKEPSLIELFSLLR